ncbi:hypothetical protein CC85DRAFT_282909 [Cutaneotrichosporon oleaginosum]|uniref:RRM domain-containing protein n=1 Tax=Cutaneotrichosporon oleaginosum TaxID=879819 RepID=A0A0J0XVA1_9TREE|nr:uncharacterized protein CC85DRAFT_282909 [Cutaneotrichosporon oleaginosum]KLT44995.1 hypothetical protein CC85DRAFT_282909 [Cutaneotrichosporon oleaginosum]
MSPLPSGTNGVMSPQASIQYNHRVVLAGNSARILCVADIRGDYHELNRLIREHEATAVIHTGDFGFLNADSLDRMGDKILRHLLQYSPLIPPITRSQLLSIPPQAGRAALLQQLNSSSIHFPLSQFPHLLSGAITFPVPVFTVWGLIEDVRIVEKFRTGEYEVNNLTVIDEASSALIETAGIKLRLFGLGGAVAMHKLFDNGEGYATIAGGQGTMWTTALQLGELLDTAQRNYDATETRMLVTSAPVTRTGLLSLLTLGVKADLTTSGGLHFRYPASLNDFAVSGDFDTYRRKLISARDGFLGVYDVVKDRVDSVLNEQQQVLLKRVMGMVQRIPTTDDNSWTNTWHWVLSDALCGHLLLSITDGRVSAEIRSAGLNFAHRANQGSAPPSAPIPSLPPQLAQSVRPPTMAEKAGVPPKPMASPLAPKAMPPKPMAGAAGAKPIAGLLKKGDGPAPGSAATANALPAGPPVTRGTRGGPGLGPVSPTVDTKSEKTLTAGKDGAPKSAKTTPSTTPASLPKDKDVKKTGSNEEKGEMDGSETPRTGTHTPKRFSLYLKGLPIPTSEAEIKAFFNAEAEKITAVKLVFDQLKRQKNFAYVDFANENDLQDVLKAHSSGSIRDSPITVEISNPPVRGVTERGGRGRRRAGRGGSSSSKDAPKGDATPRGDA